MRKRTLALLIATIVTALLPVRSFAAVVLDGTLGRSGALTGPAYAITADMGKQYGGNLFHSFTQFDLVKGDIATFSGPATVTNIISRITGGRASSLDGTIQSTISGANVYLINPAGIMFGPNATLDISGSFHASTADYLTLGTTGRFDATTLANSILTMSPPSAFGFVTEKPAGISQDNSRLAVAEGQSLNLIGGPLTIVNDDATKTVLSAPGGTINLVAVASPGEVVMTDGTPDTSQFARMGDISIINTSSPTYIGNDLQADIDVTSFYDDAGKLSVIGNNLTMDGSNLLASNSSSTPVTTVTGSYITIAMRDSIQLKNHAGITTTSMGSPLDAGPITVTSRSLVLDDSSISSSTLSEAAGSGAITVKAANVELINGGTIEAGSWWGGNGGTITLLATDHLTISGVSGQPDTVNSPSFYPFAGIYSEALDTGNAGAISITTPKLTMDRLGRISASTLGSGNAGAITINARSLLLAGGSQIISSSSQNEASSSSGGKGGDITINLTGGMTADGSATYNGFVTGYQDTSFVSGINVSTATSGDAGNIQLSAPGGVTLLNGARVESSALASSSGTGGNIVVNASFVNGTHGTISSATDGSGRAGDITITANSVELDNNSIISTTSTSNGNAGTITINAVNSMTLNDSSISTSADSANGGSINIDPTLIDLRNSRITTSVKGGTGNGGNITMVAKQLVVDQSSIIANADAGNGGNIDLTIPTVILSGNGSTISASSRLGSSGIISISSPLVNIGAGLADLPNSLRKIETVTPRRCASTQEEISSFTVLEQGYASFNPNRPLTTH